MKILILSTLTLFAATSAHASGENVRIECGFGAARVSLEGQADFSLTGRLSDAYNGARLACRNFSYSNLQEGRGNLPCVGIWNASFDENSEDNAKLVLVTLKKNHATGQITAEYLRDWDGRDRHAFRKITLTCTVQES